jgi:all-trans-retinol dehydrogenase (NAD+)
MPPTLEDLTKPIRSLALQPLLTGLLLAARLQYPHRAQAVLAKAFNNNLSLPAATQGLSALVALGLAYRLNRLLSRLSLNNWTFDRTWDWSRETVLITGGSSGIGALIASQLAERGIKVVVLDLKPPAAADSKTKGQANISFYETDVTSSSNIAAVARAIRRDVGHPTVLVNNAGIGHCKPILEETEAQIRATFDVNNIAHFLLVKEFLPHMIERNHGHVVTLASMASFVVWASNVDYSATKAAALAFHEGLGQELRWRYGADKVRTTCVLRLPPCLVSKPDQKFTSQFRKTDTSQHRPPNLGPHPSDRNAPSPAQLERTDARSRDRRGGRRGADPQGRERAAGIARPVRHYGCAEGRSCLVAGGGEECGWGGAEGDLIPGCEVIAERFDD